MARASYLHRFSASARPTAASVLRGPDLRLLLSLRRQRKELLGLNDHMLRDIGLTRHAAEREARRPFWDVPENWR